MTYNVIEAINKARDVFGIKDFPGNFFALLENKTIRKNIDYYYLKRI